MISARRLAHAAETSDAASPSRHGTAPLRRPTGPKNLAAVGLTALALLGFAVAAGQFLGGGHEIDRALLFGLPEPLSGGDPIGPKRLADLAWSLTALGSPELVVSVVAIVAGGLVVSQRRRAALFLTVTIGGGAAFAFLLKRFFGWLRPHHAPGEPVEIVLNTSFPSGHTMLATLLFFGLAGLIAWIVPGQRTLRAYALCVAASLSCAVGVSRVFLGLHWPTDVIAGWAASAVWIYLCHRGWRRLQSGPPSEPGNGRSRFRIP